MFLRKRVAWLTQARRRTSIRRPAPWHVHRFRRTGDDPLGPDGLYACRCGEIRSGI
ncbi:hypothetical protein [Candidatus Blastococcus massiliensis]|uniref:hypothetical protein n=1 Tax=Candidatus Blastococcus massiliensis TaxID=1470358 RepID=UPI0004B4DD7C|nr:hypothetical protein [Candidatus Blastococcus massiliensis]